MTHYGMAIDTKKCVGCHVCAMACKLENNLPNDVWWNRILTDNGGEMGFDMVGGSYPDNLKLSFLPTSCQHCENPACVKVCPVGATYRDPETGVVRQDYDKCIGCRMCMAACPYNARNFNWREPVRVTGASYGDAAVPERHKGVAEKCTLCKERTDLGEEPMCVVCCPAHARIFGDLDDPDSEISQTILNRKAWTLLEEQGTRPSVHYFD